MTIGSHQTAWLSRVDHLVYGVADLGQGIDAIERLLGARPVIGGRHPAYGTHNALLSLGPGTYLEVIAPDPGLPVPTHGRVFGLDSLRGPRLVTWALRTEQIERDAARAEAASVDVGAITLGARETPGGATLTWRLTDPYAMGLGGAVPFLIQWDRSDHPARSTPSGGILTGFRIEHPDLEHARVALQALGAPIQVTSGPVCRLIAEIRTDGGFVELS